MEDSGNPMEEEKPLEEKSGKPMEEEPTNKKRVAEISYSYNLSTGEGLTERGSHILADTCVNDLTSVSFLESVHHENFLPCWNDGITFEKEKFDTEKKSEWAGRKSMWERMRMDDGIALYRKPYAAHAHTFDYIFENSGVTPPFLDTYEIPSKAKDRLKYVYVPEFWRKVMKGMVSFTLYLHHHQKSFAHPLETSNFVVLDGIVKFCCLTVVDYSNRAAKDDFHYIGEMIQKLLECCNPANLAVPAELKDFIGILKNYNATRAECLVRSHVAFLSARERLDLVQRFVGRRHIIQNRNEKEDLVKYDRAVRELKGLRSDWRTIFKDLPSQFGPAGDVYLFKGFESHEKNEDEKTKPTENYENTNFSLLRFCRNLAAHLQEHFVKYTTKDLKLDDFDADLIIMSMFGKELSSFQYGAYKEQILDYIL